MEDLNTQIKKLQETIQVLLKQYKHLQTENQFLKKANESLNKNLVQKDTLLQNNQQKQTAENLVMLYNDEEKKILKQKIDFYLKDIEKCLSLLSA